MLEFGTYSARPADVGRLVVMQTNHAWRQTKMRLGIVRGLVVLQDHQNTRYQIVKSSVKHACSHYGKLDQSQTRSRSNRSRTYVREKMKTKA